MKPQQQGDPNNVVDLISQIYKTSSSSGDKQQQKQSQILKFTELLMQQSNNSNTIHSALQSDLPVRKYPVLPQQIVTKPVISVAHMQKQQALSGVPTIKNNQILAKRPLLQNLPSISQKYRSPSSSLLHRDPNKEPLPPSATYKLFENTLSQQQKQ